MSFLSKELSKLSSISSEIVNKTSARVTSVFSASQAKADEVTTHHATADKVATQHATAAKITTDDLVQETEICNCYNYKPYAVGLGTAAAAVVTVPLVVSALGFGSVGIAAGSLGTSMMSTAATTGVGMGVVGTLQSIGAAGMGVAGNAVAATAGGVLGFKASNRCKCKL